MRKSNTIPNKLKSKISDKLFFNELIYLYNSFNQRTKFLTHKSKCLSLSPPPINPFPDKGNHKIYRKKQEKKALFSLIRFNVVFLQRYEPDFQPSYFD